MHIKVLSKGSKQWQIKPVLFYFSTCQITAVLSDQNLKENSAYMSDFC